MEPFAFGVIAAISLLSAFFVVRTPNLVHAALWLGVTLLATAVLYAMLGASFLAGTQVLLYIGGVITLMIFGVMITRRHEGLVVQAESAGQGRAAVVAAVLFGVIAAAIRATKGLDAPRRAVVRVDATTSDLGRALLGAHVLAFEVVSVLLLGAIIGAIVIARKKDPVAAPSPARRAAPSVSSASNEVAP